VTFDPEKSVLSVSADELTAEQRKEVDRITREHRKKKKEG
jgi:hypothetical protein